MKSPGGRGARRIERDHLPEAGAERADHAGQTQRAHREVVVVREHLDEDGGLDRHVVPRGELVERLLGDVQYVLPQDRRLVGMETDDEIPPLDGHELVEVVHHLQQIEGHDVVGVFLERPLQRHARCRFVTGAQQVHPQLGVGARVVRIELQRSPDEGDRLGKAVGPRGLTARDAVDVAVCRVDCQHPLDLGREVVGPVLQIVDSRQERARLQAARVDLERPSDRLARGVAVAVAQLQLRDEQVRPDVRVVDAEGALHRPAGHRRVLIRQHPRHADQGRNPVFVELQRVLKRLQRVRIVVFLEEELAPGGVDRGIVRQHARGAAKERVGPPEASRGARGKRAVVLRQTVERVQPPDDDRLEQRGSLAGTPERHKQAGELQTGHAARGLPGDGRQQRLGIIVFPNLDQQPGAERGCRGVRRIATGGKFFRRLTITVRESTSCVPVELLFRGKLVGRLARTRSGKEHRQQEERERPHGTKTVRKSSTGGTQRATRPAGTGPCGSNTAEHRTRRQWNDHFAII